MLIIRSKYTNINNYYNIKFKYLNYKLNKEMLFEYFIPDIVGFSKKSSYLCTIQTKSVMIQKSLFIIAVLAIGLSRQVQAEEYPTISPTAILTNSEGTEEVIYMSENISESDLNENSESESEGGAGGSNTYSGSAPLAGKFLANPSNTEGWSEYYEWRFFKEGMETTPYLIRYEQDTDYTLASSGSNRVMLYAVFTKGNEKVEYMGTVVRYWYGEDYEESPSGMNPFVITISESKLEMPNAFSPNGDGINDIYKAKKGHQSLLEFHAIIFNRWGQKLYEWSDPDGGWDGTYKGKDVKQGVYFVLVKARGADGRVFNIKRDVNLLRGYTEATGSTSTGGGEN